MKKTLSKDQKKYLVLNFALLAAAAAFPFYYRWVFQNETPLSHCFFKEWLGIYCPLCGGTRCLYELMHFRFLSALSYNGYVVLLVALFLVWDVATLIRFLRGESFFSKIPKAVYLSLTILLILFFIVRNLLFFVWKIDFIGDFQHSNP